MELEVRNLTKKFGDKTALDNVSFVLEPGVYGLLGPNGAGKSTLMNLITTNLKPTSGEILWNGKNITDVGKDFRAVLGYMPQKQAMYPGFTAEEFLGYTAALHGMSKKDAKIAISEILEKVELSDAARHKIRTFSGGMKQRLLLAQAVLAQPQVLVLDEPTAGLDPRKRIEIRNLIAGLAADKIVLIATHVVQDIEMISREVLLMSDGKLVQKGRAHDMCRELEGKMYEISATPEDVAEVEAQYRVYGMRELANRSIGIRTFSENPPKPYGYETVQPTLEDVYFYKLGGDEREETYKR